VDCSTEFFGNDYSSHTSCITEAEKYQKSLYKGNQQKQQKQLPDKSDVNSTSNCQKPVGKNGTTTAIPKQKQSQQQQSPSLDLDLDLEEKLKLELQKTKRKNNAKRIFKAAFPDEKMKNVLKKFKFILNNNDEIILKQL
jgi:cell growth-regulating nucleolar protein